MKVGVTGKIGSGKSSFAQALFKELRPHGYELLDVDALTRQCHQDEGFQKRAMELFGTLDRQEISKACFGDPARLAALERASLSVWMALLSHGLTARKLVADFPLLIETQLAMPDVDVVVGVSAPDALRKTRACARLGWEPERFDQVDARQMGARAKMSFCDLRVDNSGGPEALAAPARRLARQILALDAMDGLCRKTVGALAFREIARAYCEPHRAYHGAVHVKALIEAADPAFAREESFVLAAAYHDIVYDTGSAYPENEARSGLVLSRHARDLFPGLMAMPEPGADLAFGPVALAGAMIDATKGHKISDPWILSEPSRLARVEAFLDADLAILGGSTDEQFWRYDDQIGEEFAHVPPAIYHAKRAEAMEDFASPSLRPRIYLTPRCQEWEPIARERLAALVAKHKALAAEHSRHGA